MFMWSCNELSCSHVTTFWSLLYVYVVFWAPSLCQASRPPRLQRPRPEEGKPTLPFKGSCKGHIGIDISIDIDLDVDMDVGMDIDLDMAVSTNWGCPVSGE